MKVVENPLIRACLDKEYLELIRLLNVESHDVNCRESQAPHRTPVLIAAEHGHLEMVHILIEFNASIEIVDDYNENALFKASQQGHLSLVDYLLRRGAYATPECMIAAAENEDIEVIRLLVISFNARNELTLLHHLVYMQREEYPEHIIRALKLVCNVFKRIARPGIVDKLSDTNMTAALMSVASGKLHLIPLFATMGANLNIPSGADHITPLMLAVGRGDEYCTRVLLHNKADIDRMDPRTGVSPLLQACAAGYTNTARALIEMRADVFAVSSTGSSALTLASRLGKQRLVGLLLERGRAERTEMRLAAEGYTEEQIIEHQHARLCAKALKGLTAKAVASGRPAVVDLPAPAYTYEFPSLPNDSRLPLPGHRDPPGAVACTPIAPPPPRMKPSVYSSVTAWVNHRDAEGRTALHCAASFRGATGIVDLLLYHRAEVNSVDEHKASALMLASSVSNNKETVSFLLESRADPNLLDKQNNNALAYAYEGSNVGVIKELLKAKCNPLFVNKQGSTVVMGDARRRTAVSAPRSDRVDSEMITCILDGLLNMGSLSDGRTMSDGEDLRKKQRRM
jgi:ankyrin repeat protein